MRVRIITIYLVFFSIVCFSQENLIINTGHTSGITSVITTPDSKMVLTGGSDGITILWNLSTGKKIRTFNKTGWGYFLDTYGNYLITENSGDKNIKLLDLLTGNIIKEFKGHTHNIFSAVFSPDGKYIVSCSGDKTIKLWNVADGTLIKNYVGHTDFVNSVNFSSDGKYIVSASNDATVKIWEVETGLIIKTIKTTGTHPCYVKFLTNSSVIYNDDYDMVIVNIETEQIIRKISRFKNNEKYRFFNIAYSNDNKYFVSSSVYEIVLWDLQSGLELWSYKTVKKINALTFSKDCKSIIYSEEPDWVTKEMDVIQMNISDGKITNRISNLLCRINSVAISNDNKYIGIAKDNRSVNLINTTNSEYLSIEGHTASLSYVTFSQNSDKFVSFSDKNIIVYDFKLNTKILEKEILGTEFNKLHFIHPECPLVIFQNDNIIFPNNNNNQINSLNLLDNSIQITNLNYDKYFLGFAPDGSCFTTVKDTIKQYNSFNQTYKKYLIDGVYGITFHPDGNHFITWDTNGEKSVNIWDINTQKKDKSFYIVDKFRSLVVSPDGLNYSVGYYDGNIKLFDYSTNKLICNIGSHTNWVTSLKYSKNGNYLISSSYDGTVKVWDMKTYKLLLNIYPLNNVDFVITTPDGKFDGTENGIKQLHFVKELETIPLESLYEQYYTPNLLARVLSGEELTAPDIDINDLKPKPEIKITSPNSDIRGFVEISSVLQSEIQTIDITVKVTDMGGGIDEILLYHNGKLVETTNRGFKVIEKENDIQNKTFSITLTNGENIIKATAFNNQRTEAIPDEITINYKSSSVAKSNLYVLVLGIDNYKNPQYSLNYAIADALAFKTEIEKGSKDIFNTVNITYLTDANATKTKITETFNNLSSTITQNDVFVMYYAGHGVMSVEDKPQFYIIPYDVTQLYGDNNILKTKAISAAELQSYSMAIKAQKQLFIFDACQSGGMTEHIAARGQAEEKAIALLARSTGTYWFSASGSEQFATEFAEIGHGVYTYAILLGLQGQADAGSKDKQITVQELDVFIKEKVPELSEKYKGQAQYPKSYGGGDDFPLIIIK